MSKLATDENGIKIAPDEVVRSLDVGITDLLGLLFSALSQVVQRRLDIFGADLVYFSIAE